MPHVLFSGHRRLLAMASPSQATSLYVPLALGTMVLCPLKWIPPANRGRPWLCRWPHGLGATMPAHPPRPNLEETTHSPAGSEDSLVGLQGTPCHLQGDVGEDVTFPQFIKVHQDVAGVTREFSNVAFVAWTSHHVWETGKGEK